MREFILLADNDAFDDGDGRENDFTKISTDGDEKDLNNSLFSTESAAESE